MKNLLICMICLLQIKSFAQDTIYKRSGDIIPAKVLEINIKEISYKRADLTDGPLFIIDKNDITKIKYATGAIEKFEIVKDAPKRQPVVFVNPAYIPQDNNQIRLSLRRGMYQYQGHYISDRNLLLMAMEKNTVWKNKDIDLNITASKRNKMLQYTIGYAGAVVGGLGIYASLIASGSATNSNDISLTVLGAMAAAGILVSSQVVSFTYKLKRVKNANKVAELYNQLSKN